VGYNVVYYLVDTVLADHVNSLQNEVVAIETTLGPTLSTTDGPLVSTWSGTFARTTTWDSLTHRIENIEAGLVNGVTGGPYFNKSGDSINPASVVGLTLKIASGTSNLLEAYNGTTLNFNIDYTGMPKVGTANVLYVGSSDYNSLSSSASTVATTLLNPMLLMGA
jgi:hypothetical protein